MLDQIQQLDARFQRFFFLFNASWITISSLSLGLSAFGAFSEHPKYLHDWHGIAIFVLMFSIPATFFWTIRMHARKKGAEKHWPPSPSFSLFCWGELYLGITLLSLLNHNFVWSYFILMGLTFSFFQRWSMAGMVVLIFLSFSFFQNLLSWPLTGDNLGALAGYTITFASLTVVSSSIQRLLNERYERGHLLQQLSQIHEELAEAHQRLAETAAQEQELAVLRERTRLAREMHDTLGHALVLVSVKLEAAQRLRERDPQRCDHELEATKEIVRNSMNELRASIANLRSPALERESACRALSRATREMAQRTNLRATYDLHPDIEGLPENVEETLWKVGQEALSNIEKHAQAHNVLLHISRQNSQVFMRISDDGIGLSGDLCQQRDGYEDHYQSPSGHYGLNGMQERVRDIHGMLSIHSHSEGGTTIEVTLPLVEEPFIAI